jgi:hypothetical protein
VLSGAVNAVTPQQSGVLSHLINNHGIQHASNSSAAATTTAFPPSSSSSSYPPQYTSDNSGHRHYRSISGTDADMQMNHGAGSAGGWRRSGGGLPAYSRQFANIPEYAAGYQSGGIASSAPSLASPSDRSFFVPSYLRNSRYVARLEAAHRSKQQAAQREPSSNPTSLSASSSHVNLHRMAPSHRGMTYDIIEKEIPGKEEKLQPLPSRWNDSDKYAGLDLLNDGLEVRYMGLPNKHDHEAAAVRADHPMPRQCGIYYFEVTILAKPKEGYVPPS